MTIFRRNKILKNNKDSRKEEKKNKSAPSKEFKPLCKKKKYMW